MRPFLLFVLLAALAPTATAQTFRGYVLAGGTASQIDGDNLAGYNKIGLLAGAGVWYDLSDKWRSSLSIAFAQNGSTDSAREAQAAVSGFSDIRLNYVVVPVSFHYMDWLSDDALYYRLEFVGGLEYRRLISGELVAPTGEDITEFTTLRDNGVGLNLGAYYSLTERSAIGAMHRWGLISAAAADQTGLVSKQFSLAWRQAF